MNNKVMSVFALDQIYGNSLAKVFKSCTRHLCLDLFPVAKGWLFLMDTDGKVIVAEKMGVPEFTLETGYPVENMPVSFVDKSHDGIVFGWRVCYELHTTGYIGMMTDAGVASEVAFAFLQGFACSFTMSIRNFLLESITSCVKEINETPDLSAMMNTLVNKFANGLTRGKGECLAVLFDQEQHRAVFHWASHQELADFWAEINHNDDTLYEKLSLYFTTDPEKRGQDAQTEESNIIGPNYLLIPITFHQTILGFVALSHPEDQRYTPIEETFVRGVVDEVSMPVYSAFNHLRNQRDEQKRNMLFEITTKIHSSIDVDDVLRAVIDSTKKLYQNMNVDLWLSHDSFSTTLPVKQFKFFGEDSEVSVQAYMEGRTIVQTSNGERKLTLAAPLRGKQGVYGVLELYSDTQVILPEREIGYITMLADTAGNAFENAQLYKQSRNVINELMLINKITKQLNTSLKLKDVLTFVTRKLVETYHTEYCCILRKAPDEDMFIVQAATDEEHIGKQIDAHAERLKEIYLKKESVILADIPPGEERGCLLFEHRSFMGVPLFQGEEVAGALLVMDSRPNYYTFDNFKMLELLAQHMNLAMTNASLHAEVERMVITDNLTGLYNRKYLYDHIYLSQQQDAYGSLILMDIDHFKRINDTYGHQTGDKILIQVANILLSSVRSTEVAARWGGEELAIYLPKCSMETAITVAERVRTKVMTQTTPNITISCGVATWTREQAKIDVEFLIQRADEALYEAKRAGRNRVIAADPQT
ncbi:sensor domain-containing diguanylate cyclase [Aneurinibacillus terranovensis]|uniref:sensor domain-containing diguanylate cyclase n=1 Tax=Aneurinibacillus terranovensis TaxID=278991 RepID=UPI00041938F1|nr:diguanylate cyclase [Aneurinibacillus terranovensis]